MDKHYKSMHSGFKKGDTVVVTCNSPNSLSSFESNGINIGDKGVVMGCDLYYPFVKFESCEFPTYVYPEEIEKVVMKNTFKIEYEDGKTYHLKDVRHVVVNHYDEVVTLDYTTVKGGLTIRHNVEIKFDILKSFKFNEEFFVKKNNSFYLVTYTLCSPEKTILL